MISWDRVRELRDEIGPDEFREVVDIFLEEVAEAVGRLSNDMDCPRIEAELHYIKGSAVNLGFEGLAEICSLGESHARAGDVAGLNLQRIAQHFETEMREFSNGLQSQGLAA